MREVIEVAQMELIRDGKVLEAGRRADELEAVLEHRRQGEVAPPEEKVDLQLCLEEDITYVQAHRLFPKRNV